MKMIFLLPLLLALVLPASPAAADEDAAQHWAQSARTAIAVDQRDPRAAPAVGRIRVTNVTTDIRFDPRNLKGSHFHIGASFLPVAVPGNRPLDDSILREATGMFFSEKISKKKDDVFIVEGLFKMNGRQQPLTFPVTVAFDRNSTKPRLIFSGNFDAPVGQMGPSLGFPTQVPMRFYVETDPVP